MYSDQEILYAMFVLKANQPHCSLDGYAEVLFNDDRLHGYMTHIYADLFADRAECEEEFEDTVGHCFSIKNYNKKIKFRFVGGE
jgi:hypothetical protein